MPSMLRSRMGMFANPSPKLFFFHPLTQNYFTLFTTPNIIIDSNFKREESVVEPLSE